MKALIRVWDQINSGDANTNVGGYKYRFDTGATLDVTPSFTVSMLRGLADDIEKEYDLKKRPTYTPRGGDGGVHQ